MNDRERIPNQKLLPPAVLTEEDEFYAECNAEGVKTFVDRVNGKPVQVFPYWIDRPNCNWHSPPVAEDEGEAEDGDDSKDEDGRSRKGLTNRLKTW